MSCVGSTNHRRVRPCAACNAESVRQTLGSRTGGLTNLMSWASSQKPIRKRDSARSRNDKRAKVQPELKNEIIFYNFTTLKEF